MARNQEARIIIGYEEIEPNELQRRTDVLVGWLAENDVPVHNLLENRWVWNPFEFIRFSPDEDEIGSAKIRVGARHAMGDLKAEVSLAKGPGGIEMSTGSMKRVPVDHITFEEVGRTASLAVYDRSGAYRLVANSDFIQFEPVPRQF